MTAWVARPPTLRMTGASPSWSPRTIAGSTRWFVGEEPGLFATAFALPQQHAYSASEGAAGQGLTPLGHLRAALDELVDADVLQRRRRDGIEYPIWSTVHGLAVLTGQGPLRNLPDATRHHLEKLIGTFIEQALA